MGLVAQLTNLNQIVLFGNLKSKLWFRFPSCSVARPRGECRRVPSVAKKVFGGSATLHPLWFICADCFLRVSVSPWWVLGFRPWLRYALARGTA